MTLNTPTFFNLPEEKREKIVNAAVEEFAEYGLENASTNRIVKNSGIAKGSFYQYFEDKQDVFKHLLAVLEQEKLDYFRDKHPPSSNLDTFEYFRWMIKTGMEFNTVNPRMAHPDVISATRRIQTGSLLSNREGAFGVSIIGIDPEAEAAPIQEGVDAGKPLSLIAQNIVEGAWLTSDGRGRLAQPVTAQLFVIHARDFAVIESR